MRRRAAVFYSTVAAAVLLALGYFGLERLNRSKLVAPAAASIAVLPLANESGEAGQQYFSDGISEDLITALGQFPGLKVIGRTSSFQFRDSKEDSRSIGAKLGVAHLLEGSVRKSGDMIRVSAELIDTADGSMQWSERYDRSYKDLFALQDEITRAVVGALRAKLLPGGNAAEQSDRPPGGSLEAYNALLQGKFYLLRWNSEADLRNAIEYFTQATDIDPSYAVAWSELSRAWVYLSANFLQDAPAQQQQAQAKARETVNRALALSPELAAAHVARGVLFQDVDLDWRAGEAELRRAVALAPNNVDAKSRFAFALATLGEVGPAVDLMRQVLATEPLRADGYGYLAMFLSGLNRLDEAEQAIRRAIELQPGATQYYVWLTHIQIQHGNAQAALAAAQQSDPDERPTEVTLAQQIGTDRNAADAALRTFIAKYGKHSDSAFDLAQIYALRNDANATFEWLDRAWSNRDPAITYTLFDPLLLRYKGDPRFAAFCRKVGLPVPGEAPAHKST
jgi:TolB-like protein/Tfp pilus assembly protein PilF